MGRLSTIKPRLDTVNTNIAEPVGKQVDPFYLSAEWSALRKAVFERDGNRCVVPGCGARAVVADHIVTRRDGGSDSLDNLRSLCRKHDNQVKEGPGGVRKSGGRFT